MTGKQNRNWLILILILTVASIAAVKIKETKFGLDIRGGVRVVLRAKTEEYRGGKWDAGRLEAVRNILERRVNSTGVAEPLIISKGLDQIVLELPGLKNETEAIDMIKTTANLEFYWLPQLGNKNGTRTATWHLDKKTDPKTHTDTDILVDNATEQPITEAQLDAVVFSKDPLVSGKDMLPNSMAQIQPNGSPVITFEFKDDGARVFEEFTRIPSHLGDYLAVFLDKKLLTAPTIDGVIPGKGIIEGSFTLESAKALADQLNAGALPVPLEVLETRKLEATLGREAVKATTLAGAFGLIAVLIFMVGYYRLPGLLADAALVLYALFSISLFKLWPITITLPGIAGFILSIGMAVDANILIFERLKEELRSGKTLRASIDAGFKRAFTAIFDSNVCTLITCSVLYYFGTGPIRGFALTLGIGVAVSMFTAITVTRTFLFALVGMGAAQNPTAYGLNFQWHPNLRVMHRKALWLGISGAIIIPGLIFWLGLNGIKKSIDFQGGTEITVPFAARHTASEIEGVLTSIDPKLRDSRVVVSEDPHSKPAFITTVRLESSERIGIINDLIQKVGPLASGQTIADVAYADVSGTISNELTWDAVKAVLVASLLIVLYLAFRFAIGGIKEGLKYGTCAVVALLHDVLVVWGAFAILGKILGWQIDSLFVTAMLTVIGFSVHDTIIIFDRIRENLQHRQKGETFSDLADRSIDQTIARSLNTSLTVVIVLVALFLAGGAIIHQFVGALIIGIVSGTYSSIFNATVLMVLWKQGDASIPAASGASTGAKTGLVSRPSTLLPGDRALVTPKPKAETASSGRQTSPTTAASSEPGSNDTGGQEDAESRAARPPRRAPSRRRRM